MYVKLCQKVNHVDVLGILLSFLIESIIDICKLSLFKIRQNDVGNNEKKNVDVQ